jgi:hypothetical protein
LNTLPVKIYDNPSVAPNYRRDMLDVRGANLVEAAIVLKGTVEGRSTVDLVFETQTGERFVALTTGAIVRMLATAIERTEKL